MSSITPTTQSMENPLSPPTKSSKKGASLAEITARINAMNSTNTHPSKPVSMSSDKGVSRIRQKLVGVKSTSNLKTITENTKEEIDVKTKKQNSNSLSRAFSSVSDGVLRLLTSVKATTPSNSSNKEIINDNKAEVSEKDLNNLAHFILESKQKEICNCLSENENSNNNDSLTALKHFTEHPIIAKWTSSFVKSRVFQLAVYQLAKKFDDEIEIAYFLKKNDETIAIIKYKFASLFLKHLIKLFKDSLYPQETLPKVPYAPEEVKTFITGIESAIQQINNKSADESTRVRTALFFLSTLLISAIDTANDSDFKTAVKDIDKKSCGYITNLVKCLKQHLPKVHQLP